MTWCPLNGHVFPIASVHFPSLSFQEQYDFLYQMVLAYLDEYETYANFR